MDKNGVMCEIEQAGLLCSCRHFRLEFVAGLPKLLLDPASPGAEPANDQCEYNENGKVRAMRRFDVERVQGLCEEVIEAQA
jgi:hypothetical protein